MNNINIYENSISFPDIFNVATGLSQYSYDEKSINECIGLLLTTARGELLGDPGYGTNLHRMIYDYNDSILHDMIQEEILYSVKRYEPRIIMSSKNINITSDENKVTISISYNIKKTGEVGDFQLVMMKEDYDNGEGSEEQYI